MIRDDMEKPKTLKVEEKKKRRNIDLPFGGSNLRLVVQWGEKKRGCWVGLYTVILHG